MSPGKVNPPSPPALTVEQKIEEARQRILTEVRQETKGAIDAAEHQVLVGIKKAVAEAVDLQYKVVIAELGHAKDDKDDSRRWKIFMAVLPVVLTAVFGGWVTWRVAIGQKDLERKLDEQKQELTARLALTQEYQKRRVTVYEGCAKNMSDLLQGLEVLRIDSRDANAVSANVHSLYLCARDNSLYVSKEVADQLGKVRSDAIDVIQAAKNGSINLRAVEGDIDAADKRMREELVALTIPLNPAH